MISAFFLFFSIPRYFLKYHLWGIKFEAQVFIKRGHCLTNHKEFVYIGNSVLPFKNTALLIYN